jgi:hypothetical protein
MIEGLELRISWVSILFDVKLSVLEVCLAGLSCPWVEVGSRGRCRCPTYLNPFGLDSSELNVRAG